MGDDLTKIKIQVTALNAAVHAIAYSLSEDQRAMAATQFGRLMDEAIRPLVMSDASNENATFAQELRNSIVQALLHIELGS